MSIKLSGNLSNGGTEQLTGSLGTKPKMSGTLSPSVPSLTANLSNLGIRGYSAYDLAVQHGFEGTEEEWLSSLAAKQIVLKEENDSIYWKYENDTEWIYLITVATPEYFENSIIDCGTSTTGIGV